MRKFSSLTEEETAEVMAVTTGNSSAFIAKLRQLGFDEEQCRAQLFFIAFGKSMNLLATIVNSPLGQVIFPRLSKDLIRDLEYISALSNLCAIKTDDMLDDPVDQILEELGSINQKLIDEVKAEMEDRPKIIFPTPNKTQ